jgi:hypothetical protein
MTYICMLYLYSIIVLNRFLYEFGQTLHRLTSEKIYTTFYKAEVVFVLISITNAIVK